MRMAIKAIHFHGSATGRLEKKRPRVKLQQEHGVSEDRGCRDFSPWTDIKDRIRGRKNKN
jgi:hypothetical protein